MPTTCKRQQHVLSQGQVALYGLYEWQSFSQVAFILDSMNGEKYYQKESSVLRCPNKEGLPRKEDASNKNNSTVAYQDE